MFRSGDVRPVPTDRALLFLDNHDQQRERWKPEASIPQRAPLKLPLKFDRYQVSRRPLRFALGMVAHQQVTINCCMHVRGASCLDM